MLGIKWKRDLADYQLRKKYDNFSVIEYANNSYTGNIKDRKSITKYCFFFDRAIMT